MRRGVKANLSRRQPMDVCFECGGKLKVVAKPGRVIWDVEDFFEIPTELKISTCLECGGFCQDAFVKAKISNVVRAQREVKPNVRLLQLRWVDHYLDLVLKRPEKYGNKYTVYAEAMLLLSFRELILSKGLDSKSLEIQEHFYDFLQKHSLIVGSFDDADGETNLSDEFAPMLRECCDVWINT